MPAGAYAILALFTVVSILGGAIASAAVGPRRAWGAIAPALAAFGALYLVGHRFAISIGPEVEIVGFRISLLFDALVALAVAFAGALLQVGLLRLLQPKERGARRNGLA